MGVNYDELVRRLREVAGWRGTELDFDEEGAEKVAKETIEWQAADAIESLQRDAKRWRFLRNQQGKPTPEEFDALIDADMEAMRESD